MLHAGTLLSACAFTVCSRYLRRLLPNSLNIVLLIIEIIPALMTTVTKVSMYSLLSFNLFFAHSFTLPDFFLNHSKSFMLSVLKRSFLHPFFALLILLWANSAPHVSWRFASTLRQVPCDHRRKWWLFTTPCLHWLISLDLTASPNDVSVMIDMGVTISMSPWFSSHSQRSRGRGCPSSLTRVRFSRVRYCWNWLNFAPCLAGVLAANRSSLAMHDLTSIWLLLISSVRLLCQMSSAWWLHTAFFVNLFAVRMFGPSSMRIQQACRHHNMRLLDTSFLWCWCLKMSPSCFLCSLLCNAGHFSTSVLNSLSVYTRMFVFSTRILAVSLTPIPWWCLHLPLLPLRSLWLHIIPFHNSSSLWTLLFHTSVFLIRASFPPSFRKSPSCSRSSAPLCLIRFLMFLSLSWLCGAGNRNTPRAFPFLLLGPTASTLAATRCLTSPSVDPLSSLRRSDCCHSSCIIVPRGREPPTAMFGATPCCSRTSPSPHSFHSLTHSILIVLSSFSCHIRSSSNWFLFFWLSVFVFMVAVQFVWLGSLLLPSVLQTYNLTNFSNNSISTGGMLRTFLISTRNRSIFWSTSPTMPCDKHSRASIPPREFSPVTPAGPHPHWSCCTYPQDFPLWSSPDTSQEFGSLVFAASPLSCSACWASCSRGLLLRALYDSHVMCFRPEHNNPSHHHLVSTRFLTMSHTCCLPCKACWSESVSWCPSPCHSETHLECVFLSCPSSPGSASFCHFVLGSPSSLTFWRAPPSHL